MTCNDATHRIHESMTLYDILYHIQYIKFSSYPVHESTKYVEDKLLDMT